MADLPVDSAAVKVFGMQELTPALFDAGLVSSGDELAVVFFWGATAMNARQAAKVRAIEKN
jgi:hypothetical protein